MSCALESVSLNKRKERVTGATRDCPLATVVAHGYRLRLESSLNRLHFWETSAVWCKNISLRYDIYRALVILRQFKANEALLFNLE